MRAEMERASNYPSLNNHIQAVGASTPWHRRVGEIDVPTIVAHGTDDPTIRFATGRALADAIPGAEFHAWEGVGHEVPDELLDEVLPILVRHTAR